MPSAVYEIFPHSKGDFAKKFQGFYLVGALDVIPALGGISRFDLKIRFFEQQEFGSRQKSWESAKKDLTVPFVLARPISTPPQKITRPSGRATAPLAGLS